MCKSDSILHVGSLLQCSVDWIGGAVHPPWLARAVQQRALGQLVRGRCQDEYTVELDTWTLMQGTHADFSRLGGQHGSHCLARKVEDL